MSRTSPKNDDAMKIVKVLCFSTPSAPSGMGVTIYQDGDGWYYLKALAMQEGLVTPFARIEDIEVHVGEKMTLISEVDVPGSQGEA